MNRRLTSPVRRKTILGISVWVDNHAEWPCEKCANPTAYRVTVGDRTAAWCGCPNGKPDALDQIVGLCRNVSPLTPREDLLRLIHRIGDFAKQAKSTPRAKRATRDSSVPKRRGEKSSLV